MLWMLSSVTGKTAVPNQPLPWKDASHLGLHYLQRKNIICNKNSRNDRVYGIGLVELVINQIS